MSESKCGCSCGCNNVVNLIFSCSGGSDVGHVSDMVARKLNSDGIGKMYCLAGIGGRVSAILKTTEAADGILAIDGFPLDCAKKSLEEAGFRNFVHLRLSDLGIRKGEARKDDSAIEDICIKAREMLA